MPSLKIRLRELRTIKYVKADIAQKLAKLIAWTHLATISNALPRLMLRSAIGEPDPNERIPHHSPALRLIWKGLSRR
jgi:hypothetical protein